jgi:hypothetical protein
LNLRGRIHFAFTVTAPRFGSNCYDFGLSPSTTRAVSFDHSCSLPQWGQNIFPTNAGSRANEASSISMQVSIGCPVTRQVVKIFGMARRILLAAGGTLGR